MALLDLDTAKYLAEKSKEWVDRQLNTYREKRSVASTIIGLNTLFVPFFLGGIADSLFWIKIVAIVPILIISVALIYLISIYYLKRLEQGLAPEKYQDAINKSYGDAILFEIAVNRDSIHSNTPILERVNKAYRIGINLTQIAIVLSIIVLSLNMFFRPNSETIKIEISKPKKK